MTALLTPFFVRLRCLLLGAGLVVGAVMAPPLSAADPPRLGPEEIVGKIERAGYGNVSRLRHRGDVYTADAMTKDGLPVHVVVNGTTGAIVGLRYIDRMLVGAPGG